MDDDFYFDLIKIIRSKGAQFVIDTTGDSLLKTLLEHPLVVKPNNHELAEMFHVKFNGMDDIVKYAKKLLEMGAQHVLISMAGDGGLMVTKDKVYRSLAPKGTVINSVGAGDSMLAGFTGTFAETKDPVEAFLISMAGDGGLMITKDKVYRSLAPKGTVINSVGAGDSMLAGFTGTFAETKDPVEAFRYGLASGSATAFSEDLATRAKIDEILPQIKITEY